MGKHGKRFFDLQGMIDRYFDDGWVVVWLLD